MAHYPSCALCGSYIEHNLRWAREFIAVYTADTKSMSACLSGPGQYQGNCIFAVIPQGTAPGRTEYVEVNFMGTAPRTQDWPALWGFPFHVSCWNILSSAWPQDPPRIQAVFDLLRSFPARDGLLNFGHKYGKNDIHLEIGPGWEPLILPERELSSDEELDPAEPISLFFPLFTSTPDNDTNSTQVKISMTGPGEDPFSSLPIELRTYIVENLSSIDVARLREVSRAFAVYVLPDSFWKSRFQPGNECGFILGPDQDTVRLRGQWKSLYSFIKPLSGLPEFKNRRRVLQLASSFRQMAHEASSKCYGTPFGIIDHHNYFVSTPIYCCDPLRYFRTGRRLLRQRIIELSVDRPAKFSFYAVLTYGLLHLSGIQLETEHSGISRLGYCSDKHAILLGSVEETLITGFCLAQDERGIRGIRVRLFDKSVSVKDEVWSQWFGDHLCLPQRRLVLSSIGQESIGSIFGGFDARKLMQLAISDGSPARLRSNEALTLRDTATWFPAIPSSDMFIRGPYGRRPGRRIIHTTAPHCLAIRGPLRIRSITAVGTTAEYLQALEILFADQEKAVSLGPAMISNLDQPRPLHVDECFNMDPESERIHQADVYITTLHRDFICLRIVTSLGRTAFFPSYWEQLDPKPAIVDIIPLVLRGEEMAGFCASVSSAGLEAIGSVMRERVG